MNSRFSRLALPLLVKELTERAARKRTYVIRVMFAASLMGVFGYKLSNLFRLHYMNTFFNVLGSGQEMFETLIVVQFFGIFLFLPAMTAGQLTLEKERDSLALLFLTRLGPWQIVLQKYLGALVPILSLLCTAMPLAAIAYAYGGVTQAAIYSGTYILTLTALQVAAFALLCSAWCRTTVGAYISTYLLGTVIYLFVPLLQALFEWFNNNGYLDFLDWLAGVYPPKLVSHKSLQGQTLLEQSIPIWLSILLFLGLARFFLVRHAFVQGTNPILKLFRWLDGHMQRLNRVTGHIRIGKSGDDLPSTAPIAWREMRKNVLARPHYLLRMLLVVEIPTMGIGGIMLLRYNGSSGLSSSLLILAALAALVISVNAANAFVSERVYQTLDILLTTPMSARQMVLEKARALHRFFYVAAVPLLTLILMHWSLRTDNVSYYRDSPGLYLFCSVLNLAIYPPLISWLSLWIGLKTKTRFQAILTALMAVVLWCVFPLVACMLVSPPFENLDAGLGRWIMGCSPAFIPILNEDSRLYELKAFYPWLPVILNFAFYGGLLCLIRRHCLRNADHYLRNR